MKNSFKISFNKSETNIKKSKITQIKSTIFSNNKQKQTQKKSEIKEKVKDTDKSSKTIQNKNRNFSTNETREKTRKDSTVTHLKNRYKSGTKTLFINRTSVEIN